MKKKKALILSKNESISRSIEIELLLLGYSVEKKSGIRSAVSDEIDAFVFDLTSLDFSAQAPYIANDPKAITLAIVDDETEDCPSRFGFDSILKYPFLLDSIRDVFLSHNTTKSSTDDDTKKIFITDRRASTVFFNGKIISLSEHEFCVLERLCSTPNESVSRDELTELLGADSGNIADVYICHLRKKLEDPFGTKVIYTLRKKGYVTEYTME